MVHVFRGDELVLDEDRRRGGFSLEDVERQTDQAGAVFFRKVSDRASAARANRWAEAGCGKKGQNRCFQSFKPKFGHSNFLILRALEILSHASHPSHKSHWNRAREAVVTTSILFV